MPDINTPINDKLNVHDDAEIKAMHDFDYDQVSKLLGIVEKISTVAPKAMAISGIALAELDVLNEQAKEIARARAERIKAAEHERYLAEQDRLARDIETQQREEDQRQRPSPRAIAASQMQPEPQPGMPSPERKLPTEPTEPVKPSAHPASSNTATIADANIDRRL